MAPSCRPIPSKSALSARERSYVVKEAAAGQWCDERRTCSCPSSSYTNTSSRSRPRAVQTKREVRSVRKLSCAVAAESQSVAGDGTQRVASCGELRTVLLCFTEIYCTCTLLYSLCTAFL